MQALSDQGCAGNVAAPVICERRVSTRRGTSSSRVRGRWHGRDGAASRPPSDRDVKRGRGRTAALVRWWTRGKSRGRGGGRAGRMGRSNCAEHTASLPKPVRGEDDAKSDAQAAATSQGAPPLSPSGHRQGALELTGASSLRSEAKSAALVPVALVDDANLRGAKSSCQDKDRSEGPAHVSKGSRTESGQPVGEGIAMQDTTVSQTGRGCRRRQGREGRPKAVGLQVESTAPANATTTEASLAEGRGRDRSRSRGRGRGRGQLAGGWTPVPWVEPFLKEGTIQETGVDATRNSTFPKDTVASKAAQGLSSVTKIGPELASNEAICALHDKAGLVSFPKSSNEKPVPGQGLVAGEESACFTKSTGPHKAPTIGSLDHRKHTQRSLPVSQTEAHTAQDRLQEGQGCARGQCQRWAAKGHGSLGSQEPASPQHAQPAAPSIAVGPQSMGPTELQAGAWQNKALAGIPQVLHEPGVTLANRGRQDAGPAPSAPSEVLAVLGGMLRAGTRRPSEDGLQGWARQFKMWAGTKGQDPPSTASRGQQGHVLDNTVPADCTAFKAVLQPADKWASPSNISEPKTRHCGPAFPLYSPAGVEARHTAVQLPPQRVGYKGQGQDNGRSGGHSKQGSRAKCRVTTHAGTVTESPRVVRTAPAEQQSQVDIVDLTCADEPSGLDPSCPHQRNGLKPGTVKHAPAHAPMACIGQQLVHNGERVPNPGVSGTPSGVSRERGQRRPNGLTCESNALSMANGEVLTCSDSNTDKEPVAFALKPPQRLAAAVLSIAGRGGQGPKKRSRGRSQWLRERGFCDPLLAEPA